LFGSVSGEVVQEVEESDTALEYYFAGNWDLARAAFQALRDVLPQCKLYALYLERIASLQSQGVGAGWNGVFEHTSK